PYVAGVYWEPQPAFQTDQIDLDLTVMDDDLPSCRPGQVVGVDSALLQRPGGSSASMTGAGGLNPSFGADAAGAYLVRTTVTDDTGLTSFIDTPIAVRLNECGIQPPEALISVLSPISEGPLAVLEPTDPAWVDEPIWLDASDSYDLDIDDCDLSQTLAYTWWFTGLPRGADADFNDPTVVNPTFVPNVPGTWEVALQVSDGTLDDLAAARFEVIPFQVTSIASGFSIAFVAGETALWNEPRGIAVDGAGAIYVVQNNRDAVTVTDAGITTDFTIGGFLDDVEDIVYDATRDQFFVTDDHAEGIVRIHSGATQEHWDDEDDLRGITLFTDSAGAEWVIAADRDDKRIRIYDPTDTPWADNTEEDFGGNDHIKHAYGVAATVIDTTEWYFSTRTDRPDNNDELWKTDGSTDTMLADYLWDPRDILVSPSGQIVVADSDSGNVYLIDNCPSGPCDATTLASGDWEPWGLAWESDTQLLVTDHAGDALYRITGTF
ncbi:MAG: hypothetical protein JRI25_09660, partial [Deltaproteobacteria bacterium]|nr:hypothetical protein [Deltaproteobacteria bacterium]